MRACDLCLDKPNKEITEAIAYCKTCGRDVCEDHYTVFDGSKICCDCLDREISLDLESLAIADKKTGNRVVDAIVDKGRALIDAYSKGKNDLEINAKALCLLQALPQAMGDRYREIGTSEEKLREWVLEAHDDGCLNAWSIKNFESDFGEGSAEKIKHILEEEGLFEMYEWIFRRDT